ncbi:FimV/HubP family polar landmark protein [Dokdonella sp.]|uniref:FimV/HubP family polar landmark protein n=1 Tax=Dokdonella sp. TaxID=2291710 RepID=UPI0035288D90
MKRPLQLSLAIALALGVTDAYALGLGAIQVKSGLNQPLVAEIPIIQSSPGEAEGLIVGLASVDDFERVGLSRSSIGVAVQFSIGKDARGEPVIKVTSDEIVREPFLGLLLEANWPKGRLLREYTVLLDPPVMAPAVKGASAVAVATKATAPTSTQPLPASKPAPKPAMASTPPAAPAAAPKASPAPAKPAPATRTAGGNEYGPVAAGETLGEIARATLPGSDVNVNQMMLALLKNNPQAFFKNNINALKRGAVLRIPSAEEIAASGSAREAAAAVRAQIDEWRGAAASSAPTLVADTTPSSQSSTARSGATSASSERLALVPPREGKAGQDADDRPSGGRAGGTGDVASKAELARVKEALTSKEQESSELRSRVKDLEEIKGKNEKLISLQSTELAELREKLKQLQEQEAKDAKAAAAMAKADTSDKEKDAVKAEAPATAKSESDSIKAELAPADDATITKDDIWGNADGTGPDKSGTSDSAALADSGKPAAAPAEADKIVDAAAPAPGSESSPASMAPEPSPPVVVEKAPPPAPAKAEPGKDTAKPVAPVKPAQPATPWYLEPMVLGAAAIGGLLLVILGIFGLRKRKPAASGPARTSIAGAFGDSPIGAPPLADADSEEQELIAQVQDDPTNAGAHLELLSLYYAQGDTAKFEAAAEEMYAYVADPNEVSWREVRTMGEELVPHNPLFSNQDSIVDNYSDRAESEEYTFEEPADTVEDDFPDFEEEVESAETARSSLETASMPALDVSDFDLGETRPPEPAPSSDTSFSFDLPPIEDAPAMTESRVEDDGEGADMDEPDGDVSDEEFFAGEDAIGTKLDLAKAYLDMGDPEGARSMLEEVLAEGNSSQQDEARKLISEIG